MAVSSCIRYACAHVFYLDLCNTGYDKESFKMFNGENNRGLEMSNPITYALRMRFGRKIDK